ncbi:MAG: gamma-butyrobetaine hydroxylase-like domain-containing protein [Chromatocurvus sp.]
MANDDIRPTGVKLRRQSRVLELAYAGEPPCQLDWEYLRVYSPSAEVRGHGRGQETLQTGKKNVVLESVIPVGHYALQLVFDDGHDSGIFAWGYLRDLCVNRERWWQDYLDRMQAAGASRDPDTQVIQFQP